LKVEFNLYRERADGEWQKMAASGEALSAGECIAFEVVNNEAKPVFLSILDFGVSGKIQLLYPPNKSSELLDAGRTLRIGSGARRIRLGLPDGFPSDSGKETFKAFITTEETDFSWLQQAGTRSIANPRSRLRRLFEAAYCGPRMREARMDETVEDDAQDWRSFNRSFVLKRG
jgi:hypothetical protein